MPCLETQFRIFISKIAFSLSVCVCVWVGKIPVLYTHTPKNIGRIKNFYHRDPNNSQKSRVWNSKSQTQISNSKKKQNNLPYLPYLIPYLIIVTGPNPSFLHQGSLSKEWKKVTNINLNHVCVDGCILYIDLSIYDQQQRKKEKESRVEPIWQPAYKNKSTLYRIYIYISSPPK